MPASSTFGESLRRRIRIAIAAAWVLGVWMLPAGHVLLAAAIVAAVAGVLLAPHSRPDPSAGAARCAQASADGIWWGLTVFTWALPHAGFPYRPDVLYPMLALGPGVALGLTAFAAGSTRQAAWAAAAWVLAVILGSGGMLLL